MFTDISDRIARNPPGHHYGIAAFDADGDGSSEFFVCGFGGPNRLLKWDGQYLRDVAPKSLADDSARAVAAAAGDFDGDGREELYVMNADAFSGPKEQAGHQVAARYRRRAAGMNGACSGTAAARTEHGYMGSVGAPPAA